MEEKKIEELEITYRVSGFYMYDDKRNLFTGDFNIDNNKIIQGKIQDYNSVRAEHLVEGSIKFAKVKDKDNTKKITINFVKISEGLLANIHYTLVKIEKPFDFLVGHYDGYWSFQEKVIPIVKGTEGETGNGARITLWPK